MTSNRLLLGALAIFLVAAVALGVTRPWVPENSGIDAAIDESLPSLAGAEIEPPADEGAGEPTESAAPTAAATPEESAKPKPKPKKTPEPTGPVELAAGDFEAAEYPTDGRARIVELEDGSRILRFEGFGIQDAPLMTVAFSEAPSGGPWGSYDDVRFNEIAELKALSGNQNYEIPADLDLKGFKSVVIWCAQYSVALGTAPVSL